MPRSRVVHNSFLMLMSAAIVFTAMPVRAADRTWSGGTSTVWSLGANWGGTAPTVTADNALFSTAFSRQPQVQANTTIGGIWVTGTPTPPSGTSIQITRSSSNALTIAGNTINSISGLGMLVNNTDGTTLDLRLPIAVSNAQEWRNTTNTTVALSNSATTISGAGNLTLRTTGNDLASAFRVDARPETFTGNLTVAQGVYRTTQANNSNSNGPLGNSANAVTLGSTGTLDDPGNKLGILRVGAASSTSNKPFTLATGGRGGFWVDHDTTVPTLTLSGKISGGGTLVKLGASDLTSATTLELTNANNDWIGGTLITDGYVSIPAGNRLGDGVVTLDYDPQYISNSGQSHSGVAGLVFTGDSTLTAPTKNIVINSGVGGVGGVIDVTTSNSTLAGNGVLSGAGAFTKAGTGSLTIAGDNSGFTGTTTVSAGKLLVNGVQTNGGLYTVLTGGTLGGKGKIGSSVLLMGGTLAPGASINPLTVSGSVTMSSGVFDWEFSGGGGLLSQNADVLGADLLNVTGALTINTLTTLNGTNLGALFVPFNTKLTVIAYGSGTVDEFSGMSDDTNVVVGGQQWRINYDDDTPGVNGGSGNAYVTLTAVPEASSVVVVGLGSLLAIGAVWLAKQCGLAAFRI